MTSLIHLERLTKRYGAITALDRVTAVVDGSIIGLLGPNGAGKSTLLKALLGLLPYEGRARVLGLEAASQGAEIRDRVGYMPEQEAFWRDERGRAVHVRRRAVGLPRTEAMQRAHARCTTPGSRRSATADRRLLDGHEAAREARPGPGPRPEILFLDEPTNGLDPRRARTCSS